MRIFAFICLSIMFLGLGGPMALLFFVFGWFVIAPILRYFNQENADRDRRNPCLQCAEMIRPGAQFCPHCGMKQGSGLVIRGETGYPTP